jgi:hypothetical protein
MLDGAAHSSREQKSVHVVHSQTLATSSSFPLPASDSTRPNRMSKRTRWPAGGATPPASLFTDGQHSPDGERAAVERVCGGAHSRGLREQP